MKDTTVAVFMLNDDLNPTSYLTWNFVYYIVSIRINAIECSYVTVNIGMWMCVLDSSGLREEAALSIPCRNVATACSVRSSLSLHLHYIWIFCLCVCVSFFLSIYICFPVCISLNNTEARKRASETRFQRFCPSPVPHSLCLTPLFCPRMVVYTRARSRQLYCNFQTAKDSVMCWIVSPNLHVKLELHYISIFRTAGHGAQKREINLNNAIRMVLA